MWAALALTTVLTTAPAQQSLELKNVRVTSGVLGPVRKENKLMPGDMLVVAFDIEGLKVKDDGIVQYAMGMELVRKDRSGKEKILFKRELQDIEGINSLGGTSVPAFAQIVLGTDSEPGDYNLRVMVKDRLTNKEAVLNKPFEVVPTKFGFVQVLLTSRAGEPFPPVGLPGQIVFLRCSLVGFKTNQDKLPHISFEMQILDEAGKPTIAKPFKNDDIKTDVSKTNGTMIFLPIRIELNRPGKYKVVLKAKDNIGGETIEHSLDLTVLPAEK